MPGVVGGPVVNAAVLVLILGLSLLGVWLLVSDDRRPR